MDDDFEITSPVPTKSISSNKSAPKSFAPAPVATKVAAIAAKPVKSFFSLGSGSLGQSNAPSSSSNSKTVNDDPYNFDLQDISEKYSTKRGGTGSSSSSSRASSTGSAMNAYTRQSSALDSKTKINSTSLSALEKAQSMLSKYSAPAADTQNLSRSKTTKYSSQRFDEDDISLGSQDDEDNDFEMSQSQSDGSFVHHSNMAASTAQPSSSSTTNTARPSSATTRSATSASLAFNKKPPPPSEAPPTPSRMIPANTVASRAFESRGTVKSVNELADVSIMHDDLESSASFSSSPIGKIAQQGQGRLNLGAGKMGPGSSDEDEDEEEDEENEADISEYYMVDRSQFSQMEDLPEPEDEPDAPKVMSFADLAAVTGWEEEDEKENSANAPLMFALSQDMSVRSGSMSDKRSSNQAELSVDKHQQSYQAHQHATASLPPPIYSTEPSTQAPGNPHYMYPVYSGGVPTLMHPSTHHAPYPQIPPNAAYPQIPPNAAYPQIPPNAAYPQIPPNAAYSQHPPYYPGNYPYPYHPPPVYSSEANLAAALREGIALGNGLARSLGASLERGGGLTGLRPASGNAPAPNPLTASYASYTSSYNYGHRENQERESVIVDLLKELKQTREEAQWAKDKLAELVGLKEAKEGTKSSLAPTGSKMPKSKENYEDDEEAYSQDFDLEHSELNESTMSQAASTRMSPVHWRDIKGGIMNKESGKTSPRGSNSPIAVPAVTPALPITAPTEVPVPMASASSVQALSSNAMIDMQSSLLTGQTIFRKQLDSLRQRLNATSAAAFNADKELDVEMPTAQFFDHTSRVSAGVPTLQELKAQFEARRLENASKFQNMLMKLQ